MSPRVDVGRGRRGRRSCARPAGRAPRPRPVSWRSSHSPSHAVARVVGRARCSAPTRRPGCARCAATVSAQPDALPGDRAPRPAPRPRPTTRPGSVPAASIRDAQVEPVEQRRREPAGVTRALHVAALALRRVAAARARVRARDEQEVGGELDRARRPAHAHDPLLERLAQRLERVHRELRELVEEQRAPVREAHLAGADAARSAADERHHRRAVVRLAERRIDAQRRARGARPRRSGSW